MVESKASAGKPEPGSRGRSGNKTAKGGKKWWCVIVVIHRGSSRHRATLGKTEGREGSGRAARGGAHEVQWWGGEAVSDIV
jgi:hypothetical protein